MFKENNPNNFNLISNEKDNPGKEKEILLADQSILSQQEKNALEDLATDFFTKYLNKNVEINDSFEAIVYFEEQINSFFKARDKDFDPREEYSGKLRAANKIIVTSLLNFCEHNSQHPNFDYFLKAVRNNFFSSSPSLSSNLDIADKFALTARATRAVENYGQIGGCMADDLVYSLSWEYREKDFAKLLEAFNRSSYAEQFDELHLIKLLAANSAGTGSSQKGLDNLHQLLADMREKTDSALLRWAIDLVEKRVDSEEDNPTLGIVKFSENVGNLRLNESLSEEEKKDSQYIEKLILPDVLVDPNNKIVRVASDTVAIVDHSNMPIKYGLFSEDEFNQKKKTEMGSEISVKDITKLESVLSQPNKINFENLIVYLNHKILIPYCGSDEKKLAKSWSEISDNLSEDDFSDFFNKQKELEMIKDDLLLKRSSIMNEAEEKNLKASENFLDFFKKEISKGVFNSLNSGFQEMIQDFIESYDKEKIELAYSTAVDFVVVLNNLGKNDHGLFIEYNKLRSLHHENFNSAEKQINDLYSKAEKDNYELIQSHYQVLSSICSDPESLLNGIAKKITEIKAALDGDVLKVNFSAYNDLTKDDQIVNFIPEDNSDETILLLKHMHRPDMESYIKDVVGINLKEIPFRYQIYLLKFLSESNEEKIKQTAEFINNAKDGDDKLNKVKSFLSLRVEESDAEKIISIDQKMRDNSSLFFGKVAQIVDLIDKKNEELQNLFFKEKKELNFKVLREKLLEKMHNIIVSFSGDLENNNSDDLKIILDKLENNKIETLFLVSVLESLKNSGDTLDLELIKNISLDIKDYGQDMSEDDKQQVLGIARDNWSDFDNKKMAETVLDGLEKSLVDVKEQKAYILKHQDDVIGFVRFEKTDHDNIYAGSFNVSKDLRGLSIGNVLMEKALMAEGNKNVLEAAVSIKIPAGCSYVEKVGFIADAIIDSYHGSGEKMFSIKLDKNLNQRLNTKNLSEDSLKKLIINKKEIKESLGEPVVVLKFDLVSEMSEYEKALSLFLAESDDQLVKKEEDKYLLTRYFKDKNLPGDVRYLVFEKN